jgi:segregation and condensation protein B
MARKKIMKSQQAEVATLDPETHSHGSGDASVSQESGSADWAGEEPAPESGESAAVEPVDEEAVTDTRAWLKGLLEAVLFVSERPLTLKELARAVKVDKKRTEELLQELRREHEPRGIRIDEVAGGFAFRSSPAYTGYVRNFLAQRPVRLSRAQLETLAIVAYRQPITRPEIDEIRGVDSGPVLKGLLERDVIRILGKKDEPGRPMLYGTTQAFLELFSMTSLRDLPTLKEFTELSDDSRRLFERETGEEAPEGPLEPDAPASTEVDVDEGSDVATASPEDRHEEGDGEDEAEDDEDRAEDDEEDDEEEDDEDDEDEDDPDVAG